MKYLFLPLIGLLGIYFSLFFGYEKSKNEILDDHYDFIFSGDTGSKSILFYEGLEKNDDTLFMFGSFDYAQNLLEKTKEVSLLEKDVYPPIQVCDSFCQLEIGNN